MSTICYENIILLLKKEFCLFESKKNFVLKENFLEPMIPVIILRCIFPVILTFIVLGLFLFTLYMVFGGGDKLKIKLRDETSQRFLQEKIPTLISWNPTQALFDMSSLCVRTGESSGLGGGWSHCRGTVQSLKNRREAWLAYTVNTHRQEGNVVLHTSTNQILVTVNRKRLSRGMRYAEIIIDGQSLGSMNIETRELFDNRGRSLGRTIGGRTIIMQGMTNYVSVEINGREIAQMNTEPFSWFERLGPMPSVFRIKDNQLIPEEEWWLVGLLAIALYRDCLSSSV
jgi:hypothetical protein